MRQAPRLLLALQQKGSAAAATAAADASSSGSVPALARRFGAPAGGPSPTTPLSPIMPGIVTIPRKVVGGVFDVTLKTLAGLATSSTVKNMVTSFGDKLLVDQAVGSVDGLDVAFWTKWLGAAGYTNHAGMQRLAAAARTKLSDMTPEEVLGIAKAFHAAGHYDKDLFIGIAAHVSAHFTQYETEGLVQLVGAMHAAGQYGTEMLDDIADSITYCNHYLAPTKVSPADLATVFAAYAKAGHERGDLFTTLARGLSEISLLALEPAARRRTVVTALKAFHDFQFFPEQTEALLYIAKEEASGMSAEEASLVAKVQAAAEDMAGGELALYKAGSEDAAHWYGHHTAGAPSAYSLYVFRDALVPSQYSPAAMRASSAAK